MSLHWFPFFPGDFISGTIRLSFHERGTYSLMLVAYYANGGPFPLDQTELYRMVGCESDSDRRAVDRVLQRKFITTEDGYAHERCERVIAEQQAAHHKRVEAAKKRWSNADAMHEHSKSNQNQNQNQRTSSVTNVTASPSGTQPVDNLFGPGLAFLVQAGVKQAQARSFLGMLRKTLGDAEAWDVVHRAQLEQVSDPIPWCQQAAKLKKAGIPPKWWADEKSIDAEARRIGVHPTGYDTYDTLKDKIRNRHKEMKNGAVQEG